MLDVFLVSSSFILASVAVAIGTANVIRDNKVGSYMNNTCVSKTLRSDLSEIGRAVLGMHENVK